MMNNPLVSFIISVYNGEKFIEKCIRSIFDQTYINLEIIIVDDASTDSTNLILNSLKKENKIKMQILKNKLNIGLTKSLNIAANNANGEWLARLDADDLSKKNRIESQINFVLNNSQYSIIGSSCDFIDKNGKYIFSKSYPSNHYEIKKALEKVGAFFPHSSVLMNKKVFLGLGGYNIFMKYSQDYELWLRASKEFKIFSIKDPLVSIRIHRKRLSNDSSGNKQLLFSRACILAYWMMNDFSIKYSIIYSEEKWSDYLQEVSKFIKKNPYYIGRKIYIKFTRSIKDLRFIYDLHNLKYIYYIFYYVLIFIFKKEIFLRKNSSLFLKQFTDDKM